MATPSTVNTWLDELSSSILSRKTSSNQSRRKLQDAFRRRARRNIYGRTNQFEVTKKLDGLEEKFQILALDNLSDKLHRLRIDLNDHNHQWLPDVLDLLLQLSGDPARNDQLLKLYHIPPKLHTPPRLRWKDILADDLIDLDDPLWKIPSFKDHNDWDYIEEDIDSSPRTSPISTRNTVRNDGLTNAVRTDDIVGPKTHETGSATIAARFVSNARIHLSVISEHSLLQEILFTLSDLPSILLREAKGSYALNTNLKVSNISQDFLKSIAEQVLAVKSAVHKVHRWLAEVSDTTYITAMKNAAEGVVKRFNIALNKYMDNLNDPKVVTPVSIIHLLDTVQGLSSEIVSLEPFLSSIHSADPISCLELLFTYANDSQAFGTSDAYQMLLTLLIPALKAYLCPVWNWVQAGIIDERHHFFVKISTSATPLDKLWEERFVLNSMGVWRPPYFLHEFLESILLSGKTAAFLKQLPSGREHLSSIDPEDDSFNSSLIDFQKHDLIPFGTTFRSLVAEHVSKPLEDHTKKLKSMLENDCGLSQALIAISQIYLAQNCPHLIDVERKIFDKIDRCIDSWNDRFVLTEMLEEAYEASHNQLVINAITIRSAYTSSRTMQSRRRSVKIIAALTLDYSMDRLLANIIDSASIKSYQRVSRVLTQIRRAKHCLLYTGYIHALTVPLGQDATPTDQKFAQVFAFQLLVFLDSVYNHFTITIISPTTESMWTEMTRASSIDAMIEAHRQYVQRIEFSCLASSRVTTLREVLIALLDMCIRFSDLVSSSTSCSSDEIDHEERSFRSARSRHFSAHDALQDDEYSEDEDADSPGEGYSSFIVLEDDATIIKELQKLKVQFSQQLELFIAGIRGVSRESQYIGDLQGLADRIVLNFPH